MENKASAGSMTKREKTKIAVSLFSVGILTAVVYWAQAPATPINSEDFQANLAGDNSATLEDDIASNERLVAQVFNAGAETPTAVKATTGTTNPEAARDLTRKLALSQLVQAFEAHKGDEDTYPKTASGTYACTSELLGLDKYFPDKKLPVDPVKDKVAYNTEMNTATTPKCDADQGYLYVPAKDPKEFNYILIAKVESTANGNLSKDKIKTDGTAIPITDFSASGEYYVLVDGKNPSESTSSETDNDKKSDLFKSLGLDPSGTTTTDKTTKTDSATDTKSAGTTEEEGKSRFDSLLNGDNDKVGSTDLGGTASSTSSATSTKKALPETGLPLAAYGVVSLVAALALQRKHRK